MKHALMIERPDDLAERLADLAGAFLDGGSEEEIFEALGSHLSAAVWAIDGPVLRARHVGWAKEFDRALRRPLDGQPFLPLDSMAIPPHFFADRRFRRIPTGFTEFVLRSMRDGTGRTLQDEEVDAALAAGSRQEGVYGPIFVAGAPWGILTVRWKRATERDLDIFTLLSAYLGASLHLVSTRRGLMRANRELRAVHGLARRKPEALPSSIYLPILENAAVITDSATATLFLMDETTTNVHLAGHFGAPCEWTKGNVLGRDEHFAHVIATREPASVERIRPEQPAIALHPLVVEDRTLGILLLARPERDFASQEMARASLLAAQLAVQLENTALLAESRRNNEILSSLYQLGRLLAQSHDGEFPLGSALDLLVTGLGYAGAWIFVREGESLELRADSGGMELPFSLPPACDADHPVSNAMRTRQTIVQGGARPFAVLPLEASNHQLGCLVVLRAEGAFQSHDHELLESYGAQLGLALERSRLVEDERARVRQLRFLSEVGRIATGGRLDKKKLLSDFLRQTSETLGFELAFGYFPGSGEESPHGGEADEPIFETMRRLARASAESLCAIRETQLEWRGEKAFVCSMPARGPEGIQAVFSLARRAIPISLQEFETLSAATSNLGFALEDAARFESAQKKLDETRLILDVGRAVTSTACLDELLDTTAGIVNRLVGATRTAIMLYEAETDELRCAAVHGEGEAPVRRGQSVENARALLARIPISTVRSDEASADAPGLFGEEVPPSAITVPMRIQEQLVGCIHVRDERDARIWTPGEIERVTVIAHQVAIGVANARLHADLQASHQELARAQEELIKKERLAALGELSAVVAHEVRNPLGVIFNSLGSLKRLIQPQGDVETLLGIMEEEANRLDRIVGDLLEFARPNPLEPDWCDLGGLTDHALSTYPAPSGIELRGEIEDELPAVYVDARLVRQALLNLIQNATHAMPKGGRIEVVVRKREGGQNLVELLVRDQGNGIPEELVPKIFEPFFTTKATGSGLGLALVKRIVEAHQGRLELHTEPGVGSTFTIVLEAAEAA